MQGPLLHCALSAAQCLVIGPVCLFMGVWLGLLPRQLEIACIDPHQTWFVGKGSDHLQLITFWPFCAPGKGVCDGAKIVGSSAQCLRLSEHFFHIILYDNAEFNAKSDVVAFVNDGAHFCS